MYVQLIRDRTVSTKEKEKIACEITVLKSGKHLIVLKSCVRKKKQAHWLESSKVFNQMRHCSLISVLHMPRIGLMQCWMRSNHLAMIHEDYSTMDNEVWKARTVHNSHGDRSDSSIPHLHWITVPNLCEHIPGNLFLCCCSSCSLYCVPYRQNIAKSKSSLIINMT